MADPASRDDAQPTTGTGATTPAANIPGTAAPGETTASEPTAPVPTADEPTAPKTTAVESTPAAGTGTANKESTGAETTAPGGGGIAPTYAGHSDAPIEALEQHDDTDSALGDDDAASSTASLNSSIFEYRKLHGRTYHRETGNAHYWGANDSGHNESLDVLHHLFCLILDGQLYEAPIGTPKKVLDIGTGTGIWAIDMGDKFPDCEVTGTDISPIQPSWVPPNVRFEIEDATQEWTFKNDEFDFVHIRYLMGCIPDWTAFFKEAYRVLKPGGYLQSYESSSRVRSDDGTLPDGSALSKWESIFTEGGLKLGRSFSICDDGTQRKAVEDAGFVDIQEKWIKVPSGSWPADPRMRHIGEVSQFALFQDIEGFILYFADLLGWSLEETHVYSALLRKELRSGRHHVYYRQKIVWGRKPFDA